MPPKPPAAVPQTPDKPGVVERVGGPRNAAIIGAGGTVALVGLFAAMRSKKTPAADPDVGYGPTQEFDSGPYDMWNQWQSQYEDLQHQVDDLKPAPTPTPKPPTPLPVPVPKPPPSSPAPRPPSPVPKPPPKPAASTAAYVTIKKGDTLSAIAARAKISMATLKKLNPVFWTNPKYKQGNLIWSGGKVRIK